MKLMQDYAFNEKKISNKNFATSLDLLECGMKSINLLHLILINSIYV